MKVKVGDKIYDGDLEPVMVILTKEDIDNISRMDPNNAKYCQYPSNGSEDMVNWIKAWMAQE